jgi:hypothetical protein
MSSLPEKPIRGSWVQTEREAHEAWAKLIRKSPKAAELMHLITARIGENNAVVMSITTIMKLMATSRPTVVRAINLLREDRWVETVQIGGSGTTNAYVVNDRVAWTGPRDGIRFSLFSAAVIATDDEQIDRDKLGKQEPLRRLPQIGEFQIPHGSGLPPPSQPFLNGMEAELPASGSSIDPDSDIPPEIARAVQWWHRLPPGKMEQWYKLVGQTAEAADQQGTSEARKRPIVEIAMEAFQMHQEIQDYRRTAHEERENQD